MGSAASLVGEDQWLKIEAKTCSVNAPVFGPEHCLSTDEADGVVQAAKCANESAHRIVQTNAIDDSLIKCYDINTCEMLRAKDHFIILVGIDVKNRTVEVEFVSFKDISKEVFGWSYRWATPVNKNSLISIDIKLAGSDEILYKTNVFEMELEMLQNDVLTFKKVWMDIICVPQKSEYTGYQVAAMGTFYQHATTILREVRDPTSLPMVDYLSRAWTYQEARYGKTICDNNPSIYLAREWAEMLWGRQFIIGLSGLLYQIPNLMARSMDIKTGPNNITYEAMRNCIGSGQFFQFFVKNFRRHEGFPSNLNANKSLLFLEKLGEKVGIELDQKLKDAFWKLPRVAKGTEMQGKVFPTTLLGPNDCRIHPEFIGDFWIEVVKMRNEVDLEIDETCVPEIIAEMSLRKATFESDRFIGTWAVLLKHLNIPIVMNDKNYPDAELTWQKVVDGYKDGVLR